MNIKINPKIFFYYLLIVIGLLLAIHIAGRIAIFKYGVDPAKEILLLFDLDGERNVSSFYSSMALLFSSILLYFIGRWHTENFSAGHLYWHGLSIIFLYLALDENMAFHEDMIVSVRRLLRSTGVLGLPWLWWMSSNGYVLKTFLNYAWTIPYGIGLLLLGLTYINFIKILPCRSSLLFMASGMIYVAGAIGFELISGFEVTVHGQGTALYTVFSTLEEVLEMLGIALFNYALLDYISERIPNISFNVEKSLPTK